MGLFEQINELHPTLGQSWQGRWPAGYIEGNRYLYDYGIVFYEYGECRLITERRIFHCERGCVVVLPPGMMHCTIVDAPVSRWCLHFDWYGDCRFHHPGEAAWCFVDLHEKFDPALVAAPPRGMGADFPFFVRLNGDAEDALQKSFRRFFSSPSDTFSGLLERHAMLRDILALIFDPGSAGADPAAAAKRTNSVFLRAKSRFDSGFTDPDVNVGKVAAELKISSDHLSRLFRKNLGTSCSDYLQMLRMNLAERQLSEGVMSIQEVAFACGFADANYFSRCFRKRRYMTPGLFRKTRGGNAGE